MNYEELETRIVTWVASQENVRALIAVGSTARGDTDDWSDLDLVLFTYDRDRYTESAWLYNFGDAWLTYKEEAAQGDPEWYALYDEGLKVDIVLLQVEDDTPDLESLLPCYPYETVFARGVNVLFDRYGEPRSLSPGTIALRPVPTAADFEQTVNGFLLQVVTMAKFIARGDLWRAHHWIFYQVRPCLLRLIEWHAHGRDTWYNGRYMSKWADSRILTAVPETFATYERESLMDAIRKMLELFRFVGEETASKFGVIYPVETNQKTVELVEHIFKESPQSNKGA